MPCVFSSVKVTKCTTYTHKVFTLFRINRTGDPWKELSIHRLINNNQRPSPHALSVSIAALIPVRQYCIDTCVFMFYSWQEMWVCKIWTKFSRGNRGQRSLICRIITVTRLTGQHRAPLDWGPGRDYLEPGYVGLRCSGRGQVCQCVDIIINIPNIVWIT